MDDNTFKDLEGDPDYEQGRQGMLPPGVSINKETHDITIDTMSDEERDAMRTHDEIIIYGVQCQSDFLQGAFHELGRHYANVLGFREPRSVGVLPARTIQAVLNQAKEVRVTVERVLRDAAGTGE